MNELVLTVYFYQQPLTDKLKKYVLGLDIEADARLLSERLNICQEAIDYFRASSSLLKAGVQAGLSLYQIACMCCRNDNSAEIPSMLEKLVDMASELASIAIENDRWHHAAASHALAEQLSPRHKRRSSMISRVSSDSSSRLSKSISSAEFLLLHREVSEGTGDSSSESPAMAQSSASDSSMDEVLEDGAIEKEECNEWAASVILDVSVDADQVIPTHRTVRSSSIASDDASSDSNLSSSPKGFWHIKPGTSLVGIDDGSICWSTGGSSPRVSGSGGSECSEPPPVNLDESQEFKSPTITFANLPPGPYLHPKTVNVSKFKASENKEHPLLQRTESGMSRSKSYTALSQQADTANKDVVHSKGCGDNYDTYRKYFHKFIDLVIVRETTAALHHSKHGGVKL